MKMIKENLLTKSRYLKKSKIIYLNKIELISKIFKDDDKSDDDDDIGVDAVNEGTLRTNEGTDDIEVVDSSAILHPRDIDAHWIQRALSKFYEPIVAQEKVKEVLHILQARNFFKFRVDYIIFIDIK